jgi:hypothetical protein
MVNLQYQSPAERWKAEKSRPKVRHYTIINKIVPPDQEEKQDGSTP